MRERAGFKRWGTVKVQQRSNRIAGSLRKGGNFSKLVSAEQSGVWRRTKNALGLNFKASACYFRGFELKRSLKPLAHFGCLLT